MTAQELIGKIREILADKPKALAEFNQYDAPRITENNPSYLVIGFSETRTDYYDLSPAQFGKGETVQQNRIMAMRWSKRGEDPYIFDLPQFILYKNDKLEIVNHAWAVHLIRIAYQKFADRCTVNYPDEFLICDQPLLISWTEGAKERFRQALDLAKKLEDSSLIMCIERLSHYSRVSDNQIIVISKDFAPNSFSFAMKTDGEVRLNGGIIFYNSSDGKHWHIHT